MRQFKCGATRVLAINFCVLFDALWRITLRSSALRKFHRCRLTILNSPLQHFSLDFFCAGVAHVASFNHVHHIFGHVFCMITDALDGFTSRADERSVIRHLYSAKR